VLKKIDIYIIKKFLGTFAFAIFAFIWILIIFDISEKIEDFIEHDAPVTAIIFEYYMNFIPYFINMLSPLFIFISVILFTSKLAADTEIIAVLSAGISFNRLMRPYLFSAIILAGFSFALNNYLIPPANKRRLAFEEKYYRDPNRNWDKNIHKQISPGEYIYMESYSTENDIGYQFSMEKFNDEILDNKLISDFIKWDSLNNKWVIHNYRIRYYLADGRDSIVKGNKIDTTLSIHPNDFKERENIVETMNLNELNEFIDKKTLQGASNVQSLLVAKYQRLASPFSAFILTLIGVSLSSRKVRGGIGINIGIGLLISASYILFMQISTNFAIGSSLNPILAVWIPNILYSIIGIYLYIRAPK
jgi:lipopolysaccharide export system permease protein